jgi:hypothetical protein
MWRHYYTQLMKNHGQGNKFKRSISLAGKGSGTGKEEVMSRGIYITSLIYTRPTDYRPCTGLKLPLGLYNTTCDRMILYR